MKKITLNLQRGLELPTMGLALGVLILTLWPASSVQAEEANSEKVKVVEYREVLDDPYMPVAPEDRVTSPAKRWLRGGNVSVQVNVDALGNNVVGDAANEPSLAVDPNNPSRIAIGWRQFDTIASNFRQAGYGFTTDGGASWTVPSPLEQGIFRSDPVLTFDSSGNFYYYSLQVPAGNFLCDTFKSTDQGATWGAAVSSFGGDKAWVDVDRSGGVGDGHIYSAWSQNAACCGLDVFTRSANGGASFETPVDVPERPIFGSTAVGPNGEVLVAGRVPANGAQFVLSRSTTAQDTGEPLGFTSGSQINLGGSQVLSTGPNPAGLLGQVWVVANPAPGPHFGEIYVLSSIDPGGSDPMDVHLVRSTDDGATWSAPVRINDDTVGNDAWQWFGTLSVAPNGRLDVIWNDTRADPGGFDSELYYSFSVDGGRNWSKNEPLSPAFDPHLGWPQQNKLGDYYHMISHNDAAHLAYAATFNGEQDVYYLRIQPGGLFEDGFESGDTSAWTLTFPN